MFQRRRGCRRGTWGWFKCNLLISRPRRIRAWHLPTPLPSAPLPRSCKTAQNQQFLKNQWHLFTLLCISLWTSPESASSICLVWFEMFCLLWLCCPRTRPPRSHQRNVCSSALESFVTYFRVFNLHHHKAAGKGVSDSSCEFSHLENARKNHVVSTKSFHWAAVGEI